LPPDERTFGPQGARTRRPARKRTLGCHEACLEGATPEGCRRGAPALPRGTRLLCRPEGRLLCRPEGRLLCRPEGRLLCRPEGRLLCCGTQPLGRPGAEWEATPDGTNGVMAEGQPHDGQLEAG
jgi:hypothetical protein